MVAIGSCSSLRRNMNRIMKIGVAMVAVGLIAVPVFGVLAYLNAPDVDGYPRANDRTSVVELTAGGWDIYVEDGRLIPPTSITDPNGSGVEIRREFNTGSSYYSGETSGTKVAAVDLRSDGEYVVDVVDGQTISFVQGLEGDVFRSLAFGALAVLSAIALVFGGGCVALFGFLKDR